jgi:cell division protease FtsH
MDSWNRQNLSLPVQLLVKQASFFSISCPEFVEMFVGVGAFAASGTCFEIAKTNAPLHRLTTKRCRLALQRVVVLGGGNDEREQPQTSCSPKWMALKATQASLLAAATNRPDVLDSALHIASTF